ncbi:hypothetical protein [Halobaculum rarum]|uniref:hypothetical protein n=1 Tax=Halobaculum rarum TaxID=3075122 RepID=UPI0032AE9514
MGSDDDLRAFMTDDLSGGTLRGRRSHRERIGNLIASTYLTDENDIDRGEISAVDGVGMEAAKGTINMVE